MWKPLEAIKAEWVEKLDCQDAFCLLSEARLISWLQCHKLEKRLSCTGLQSITHGSSQKRH